MWRLACAHHHHLFDYAKKIRLTEDEYPESVHRYAKRYGFYFCERRGWIEGAGQD